MKDLDKLQIYDLRGITEEQGQELLDWLVKNDVGWKGISLHSFMAGFLAIAWSGDWDESFATPTAHISTLFETSYEEQLKHAKEQLEHYKKEVKRLEEECKPEVGDVCKFWDVGNEGDFITGVLTDVSKDSFGIQYGDAFTTVYDKAKKVTEQEVIDLLFNKS